MREIKFRVWDKELKTMHVCGEDRHDSMIFLDNTGEYYNLQNGCGSSKDGESTYYLMQYTGLKDMNGKEIYEGDIVVSLNEKIEMLISNSDTGIGYVEWLNNWGFWNVCGIENGLGDLIKEYNVQVIGNIYENPELLEGSKE